MSDSNRIRVSIVPEVTFGTTPSNPAYLVLGTTGESLRDRVGYQQSATINNDRNVQDLLRLSKSAGGGIPMELTYSLATEGLGKLLLAAMANTETAVAAHTGCTATNGAKTLTKSGGDLTSTVEVGDIVCVTLASTAANNGYYKVSAVAATTITVLATANFTGDESCTVTRAARTKNGTVENYFSIEVARLDLQVAQVFTGCAINSLDFSIADEAITTANFSVQSANSVFYTANNGDDDEFGAGNPTYTAAATNPVLDSLSVPEIRSGGIAYAAKSVSMTLSNNVAPRTQIGALGAQSMRFGEFNASGTISAYMSDFADLQKDADNTATDIWIALIDSADKGYSISFPQIKFSDAGADVAGSNQDVMKQLSVTAVKDPVELCTVRFQRWA